MSWNLRGGEAAILSRQASYWYWQQKSGRALPLLGTELPFALLISRDMFHAWDRSLGAWVVYAA